MSNAKEQAGVFAAEGANAGIAFKGYVAAFVEQAAPYISGEIVAEAAARAFASYYEHVLDLAVDKYGIPREEETEDNTLCAECWCNDCAARGECEEFSPTDGITPPPCAACEREIANRSIYAEYKPLMPSNAEPRCGGYEPESVEG
jgi:hypothetical protein